LKRGRKSSRDRVYEAGPVSERTLASIYATLPQIPRSQWTRWTYDRLRRSQPVAAAVNAVRSLPRQVQVPRRGARGGRFAYADTGHGLVDIATGELLSAKHVAEKEAVTYDPCKRAKDDRRGAVLAGGFGGKNGVRSYKRHSEC